MALLLRRATENSAIWVCGMADAQWAATRAELALCRCTIEDEGRTYKILRRDLICPVHSPLESA